jgi:hypothetical protein
MRTVSALLRLLISNELLVLRALCSPVCCVLHLQCRCRRCTRRPTALVRNEERPGTANGYYAHSTAGQMINEWRVTSGWLCQSSTVLQCASFLYCQLQDSHHSLRTDFYTYSHHQLRARRRHLTCQDCQDSHLASTAVAVAVPGSARVPRAQCGPICRTRGDPGPSAHHA